MWSERAVISDRRGRDQDVRAVFYKGIGHYESVAEEVSVFAARIQPPEYGLTDSPQEASDN